MLDDDYVAMPQRSRQPFEGSPNVSCLDGKMDDGPYLRDCVLAAAERLLPNLRRVNEAYAKAAFLAAVPAELEERLSDGIVGKAHGNSSLQTPTPSKLGQDAFARSLPGAKKTSSPVLEQQPVLNYRSNSDEAVLIRDARRKETQATLLR